MGGSTCPKKGEAVYFSIQAKSGPIPDAGWSYETPLDAGFATRCDSSGTVTTPRH